MALRLDGIAIIPVLNSADAPTAVMFAGAIASLSAWSFSKSGPDEGKVMSPLLSRSAPALTASGVLFFLTVFNSLCPINFRPVLVKDLIEKMPWQFAHSYEKWNSYSRIYASAPFADFPHLWGPSPKIPFNIKGTSD